MRTVTKMQIMAAVLVGFFLGYVLLPSTISFSTDEAAQGDPIGKGFYDAKPRAAAIQISPDGRDFIVEGRAKRILSGAIHYFRVVPDYWDDRLRKLRASGLNTVETYVPWNAHEPVSGVFDFTGILDVAEFIKTAQHLGLHVIVRPGPYICAEWEMGGLPALVFFYCSVDVKMLSRSLAEPRPRVQCIRFTPPASNLAAPVRSLRTANNYY
jgi:beta-galactosidase